MVSSSINQVDNTVKEIFDILIQTSQSCEAGIAQDVEINVNADNCDINIQKLSSQQTIAYRAGCISEANVSADIDQKLKNLIDQKAKALSTIVGGGVSTSANITKNLTVMATSIKESFSQKCSLTANQKNVINISCTSGNTVNIGSVSPNQNVEASIACVLETDSVTKAVQDLKNTISQTAESSKKGTIPVAAIIGIIVFTVIIIIIIVIVVYSNSSGSDSDSNN